MVVKLDLNTDILRSIFGAHEWTHGSMSYILVHGQCRNQPQKPAVFRCSGKLWEFSVVCPSTSHEFRVETCNNPTGPSTVFASGFWYRSPEVYHLKFHWIPHEMCVGCAFWCVQSATKVFRSTRQHLWQMRSLNRLRLLSASRKKMPWDYAIESW